MSVPALLAARELRRRWGRAALACAVVAGAVALSVGLELLGRARERAVEAQLDAAGPAIRILARGASAEQAALPVGEGRLRADAETRARAALGGMTRRVEARAVLRDPETGALVVALFGARDAPRGIAPGHVILGAGLAERADARGDRFVRVLGRSFVAGGVAPSNADATDYAVHVLAADVGDPAPNELRVFLEPGIQPGEAEQALQSALPDASVVRSARGEVADGGLQGTIASHRRMIQLVTALIGVLALAVATHLDVSERRRELALLAAVGLPRAGLATLVVARAMLCALAGAFAGIAAAVALAASRPEFLFAPVPAIAAVAVILSMATTALAAAPVAFAAASSDPVAELQES